MTASEAMQKKSALREKALNEALQRTAALDEKYPDIAEIDKELSAVSSRIIAAMRSENCEAEMNKIKERNLCLQEERRQKLLSYGIPEDYDTPVFSCPVCGDTGYDGKTFCSCVIKMCAVDAYLSSGLGKALLDQTFENFSLKYYGGKSRDDMSDVLDTCIDFAQNFGTGANLLLTGGTGLGKTHLSSAIAQKVIDKGYTVVYESAQTVFDAFESVRFGRGNDNTDKYITCDLLIIDDLGTEFSTQYTAAVLYQLVNQRLVNGKSLILSTNLGGKELLKRYGERIYSRLLGSFDTCVFSGSDVRLIKLGE
ncbi:MAG: ATP-binding protein [Clostridia bacterium]|nr:ATP-binding protein [Clostridia bacterium]